MAETGPEKKAAAGPAYVSMRAMGVLLTCAGFLAALATFVEGPLIGAGLASAGVLLWLAGFGGQRGWRWFPAAPLLAAAAALVLMTFGCYKSLAAR